MKDEQPFKIEPAFASICVCGNKVHAISGKFPTFTAALHDLVDQWEANPSWTSRQFSNAVEQLCVEWY